MCLCVVAFDSIWEGKKKQQLAEKQQKADEVSSRA